MRITFKLNDRRISKQALKEKFGKLVVANIIFQLGDKVSKEVDISHGIVTDVYYNTEIYGNMVQARVNLFKKKELDDLLSRGGEHANAVLS